MRWRGRRGSANIEDRRGASGGGPRIGVPLGRGGRVGGLGAVALIVIALLFGVDPGVLLQGGFDPGVQQRPAGPNRIDDDAEAFLSVVLADTEEVWADIFETRLGQVYQPPTLVLFSGATQSACGGASAAVGPFYCPADRKAYLDTDFFQVLEGRLGAGGDFARAYVVAHEIAHHVQNLIGVLPEANRRRAAASEVEANRISVRIELQADCLSGVWAKQAERRFGSLEAGDIEEALDAAARIGDDALQKASQGHVVPDSFTHGSSAQRVRWFNAGYRSGDLAACDTFAADRL